MVPEQQRLSPAERANLVAYLDRELNQAESHAIAAKLHASPSARRELESLQKTWELLDQLPRPEASSELTARTLLQIEQLTLPDDRLVDLFRRAGRGLGQALVLMVATGLALAIGYVSTRHLWPNPTARLIQELSLAENLDAYQAAGTFAFLHLLDEDATFARDVSSIRDDSGFGGAEENERRLREMPRERRLELARNLERFDRLPDAQQATVLALDQDLETLDEANRGRYLSLLDQYALWVRQLPPDRQEALNRADLDERLALVRRESEEGRPIEDGGRSDIVRWQFALLGPISLFDAAHLLKVWLELTPERRAEVEALRPIERFKRLVDLGEELGIVPRGAFLRDEKSAVRRRLASVPQYKKELDALKGQDLLKRSSRAQQFQRWAEGRYFLDNLPESVSPGKLSQFASALPNWFSEQFEPLPPDAARRRLAILYRLIYPAGTEMPDNLPETPSSADPAGSANTPEPATTTAPSVPL